jgi:hypothetical protein
MTKTAISAVFPIVTQFVRAGLSALKSSPAFKNGAVFFAQKTNHNRGYQSGFNSLFHFGAKGTKLLAGCFGKPFIQSHKLTFQLIGKPQITGIVN